MPVRAALLTVVLSLLVAPAAQAAVPKGWVGVHVDGPMTDGRAPEAEWDELARSDAGFVRAAFRWSEIEPAEGSFDFAAPDALVAAAAARRIPVLPVVHWTPLWAMADPGVAGSPPRDPAAYGRLLTALVGRYGQQGSFWRERPGLPKTPIRAWQIWNEPGITRYWSRQPFAAGYVRVLKAAHRAIKAADRRATVLLAGLPNKSWRELRALYAAGARGHFDAVALHPYTGRPADVVRIVEYNRREMRRARDGARPVWITELSWPAAQGRVDASHGFETTDRGQASRLTEGIRLLDASRRRLRIAKVVWYTWLSADEQSQNAFDYSGLRRWRAGTITSVPALDAFRRAAR
jgi:hypothetical protein